MGKIAALFKVFRKGNEVANPEGWKNGQVTANTVAALLTAVLAALDAFNIHFPVPDGAVLAIAGGLFAAVNVGITLASSKRVGLPGLDPLPPDRAPDIDRPAHAGGNRVDDHERSYPRDTGG